jgi:hypothetical protein
MHRLSVRSRRALVINMRRMRKKRQRIDTLIDAHV